MKELAKICPKCKKENRDSAKFCESCGTDVSNVVDAHKSNGNTSGGLMDHWNKRSTKGKAGIGIVGLCCLGLILIVVFGGLMSPDKTTSNGTVTQQSAQTSQSTTSQSPITVKNLKVTNAGYGEYKVTCSLIPNQDESYLEMATIWYDSSGAVIEQNTLAWNIDDAKAGQTYKVTAPTYLYDEGTPTKVDVLIFDSVFSGGDASNAIYNQTLTV